MEWSTQLYFFFACGKTTFINNLAVYLSEAGAHVDIFKAPNYDSHTGRMIKSFLDGS